MEQTHGDATIAFLSDGYRFGLNRFERLGTDAFRTRLGGLPMTFLRGANAAGMFYGGDRFTRQGAMPPSVVHLLQDRNSVQALDGARHMHRKAMFVKLLTDEGELARLSDIFTRHWEQAKSQWHERGNGADRKIVLHDAAVAILARTAIEWAGIPLEQTDVNQRTQELAGMVEYAGSFGPRNWIAQLRRRRTEAWARDLVHAARAAGPDASPLAELAHWDETDGAVLSDEILAVELLNLLRPIVAVARFIVFSALALYRYPQWQETFRSGDYTDLEHFVHEVRRLTPFFPVIAGRAREDFSWQGHQFTAKDRVVLDLFATNHDPVLWTAPYKFVPERFRDWNGDPNTLIPQGAGEVSNGHRCPGEKATIELMKAAVRCLTQMEWSVPKQNLRVNYSRFPALPQSGFVMEVA